MVASKDIYMQFRGTSLAIDGTNSTTVVRVDMETGLTIRGGLAWLIHKIEARWSDFPEVDNTIRWGLSALSTLAGLPNINGDGTLAIGESTVRLTTSGIATFVQPHVQRFLPPLVYARSKISLYAGSQADEAGIRGDFLDVRIGYTTVKLDPAVLTEIIETWGG